MGASCSSCCGGSDDNIYEADANDKTNLLGNPVGESSRSISQSNSSKHSDKNSDDQQAKLNQILQKTANSYIDVPALNSPVDQSIDQSKDYESKIKVALRKQHQSVSQQNLLKDTPHVERLLSEEPLSENDQKMMNDFCTKLLEASRIEIQNSESLIIPFDSHHEK